MKQKIMRFDILVTENNGKKGLVIKQEQKGDWSVLEELGVIDALHARALQKLNKLKEIKGGKI